MIFQRSTLAGHRGVEMQLQRLRRASMAACLAVVVATLVAVEATPATAGVTTVTDPAGDVIGGGLTSKERAAIDITSVTISGEEALGVLVHVQLAGNFTKRIGLGHLKKAQAELVLFPSSPELAPASLTTKGPGLIGETVRNTSSKDAGVVRNGSSLTFFIFGPGFSNVDSAEINVFVKPPPQGSALRQPEGSADSTGPVPAPKAELTCAELADELERLTVAIEKAKAAQKKAEADLERIERDYKASLESDEEEDFKKALKEIDDFAKKHSGAGVYIGAQLDLAKKHRKAAKSIKKAVKSIKRSIENLETKIIILELERDLIKEKLGQCKPPGTLGAVFDWDFQSEVEVRGTGSFSEEAGRASGVRAPSGTADIDAVKVVIPPDGSTGRQITNQLCPSQLPNPSISTTTYSNDTLTCSGGTLAIGEQFSLNVRTSPPPTADMGGQLYGSREGSFQGPFQITGP